MPTLAPVTTAPASAPPTPPTPPARPVARYAPVDSHPAYKFAVLFIVVAPFVGLLIAMWQLWDRAVGWGDVALLLGMYIPISLGVTIGFHRMLTHKSFRAHPAVKFVFLVFGSMAIEGSCIGWAANHLLHHQLADEEGDPHSPTEGLWHAHMGWLFDSKKADPEVYCKGLLKDPIVVFVDRTFPLWVVLSFLIPFAIGGWQGLLWGGLVRMFFVHHITWSVNSVCHTWGSRPYETTDRSRNNWLVGLLAFGEGHHNNHHRWPKAAIHGMDRWQIDGSAFVIQVLEKLRLVSDVHRVSWETRLRARMDALAGRGVPAA